MRKKLITVFLTIFISCLLSSHSTDVYEVTRVIDGDTIVLAGNLHVRLLGVDAPELRPKQCFAKEAKEFVQKQIQGKSVEITFEGKKQDRYGRTLAWVWYGANHNTLLNAKIVERGYGFSYRKYPTSRLKELNKLEDEARKAQRGLWSPKTCLNYYTGK